MKTPPLKTVVILLGAFVFFNAGMIAGYFGVEKFRYYINPDLYVLILGILGLIAGLIFTSIIKPHITKDPRIRQGYVIIRITFSIAFIGIFLMLGHSVNKLFSDLHGCENFIVVDKEFFSYRGNREFILSIEIEGVIHSVKCYENNWNTINIGQSVNICIFKSIIGLDFYIMPGNRLNEITIGHKNFI